MECQGIWRDGRLFRDSSTDQDHVFSHFRAEIPLSDRRMGMKGAFLVGRDGSGDKETLDII